MDTRYIRYMIHEYLKWSSMPMFIRCCRRLLISHGERKMFQFVKCSIVDGIFIWISSWFVLQNKWANKWKHLEMFNFNQVLFKSNDCFYLSVSFKLFELFALKAPKNKAKQINQWRRKLFKTYVRSVHAIEISPDKKCLAEAVQIWY